MEIKELAACFAGLGLPLLVVFMFYAAYGPGWHDTVNGESYPMFDKIEDPPAPPLEHENAKEYDAYIDDLKAKEKTHATKWL